MTADSRKNLQFSYNFLNLLNEVRSGSTVKAKYTWLADGSKLRVRNNSTAGFDYLGSLTYTSSSSGLTLETAQFAGGVIRSGNSQEINYFITDHLGSVRAIVNSAGTTVEQNDYYAFGAKHVRSTYAKNSNRLDFNGKEEQTTGDLKYLDYGARMYDPAIGRWFNTDPLAEKYYPLSQYNYALNNPVFFIDPDGRAADGYLVDHEGTFQKINNVGGDQYDVIYSGQGFWDALVNWVMGNGFTTSYSITISPEFMDNHDQFKREEYIDWTGENTRTITSDYYITKDSKESKKIFEFLVNNTKTKVEWLNTSFKMEDGSILNTIMTSHESGRIFNSSKMKDAMFDKGANLILRSDHNHFDDFTPSGIDGDMDVLRDMRTKWNSPDVKTNIYFNKKYYPYK